MIVEPQPQLLIQRICESLEQSVQDDPASALAKRQLRAGLWTLRSLASRLDVYAASVAADIADMEAVLRAHLAPEELHRPSGEPDVGWHKKLQALVVQLEAGTSADGIARELRALHVRMAERGGGADASND